MRILEHFSNPEMNKTDYISKLYTITMMAILFFAVATVNAQEKPFNSEQDYYPDVSYESVEPTEPGTSSYEVTKQDPMMNPVMSSDSQKKDEPKQEKAVEGTNTSTESAPTNTTTTNDGSESVLSFNILFYIIQKFKFTEVGDQ
jgi:cytoskeletal protein RodZ